MTLLNTLGYDLVSHRAFSEKNSASFAMSVHYRICLLLWLPNVWGPVEQLCVLPH